MWAGVFIIVIVEVFAPVGRGLAFQKRHEAAALHFRWYVEPGGVEKGLGEVEVGDDVGVDRPRQGDAGPADEQGGAERFLEDPSLVKPAVLAEEEPLVRGVDDDRIVGDPLLVQGVEHPADALVNGLHAAEVIVQISVVLPAHKVLAGEVRFAEGVVARGVVRIPLAALAGVELRGRNELEVFVGQCPGDGHVLVMLGLAAPGVVVEEGVGLGIFAVAVVAEVAERGLPFAMGGFMLAHQQERARAVAILEPVERQVGDDVGGVPLMRDGLAVVDHRRVVVHPLAGEDVPFVEPGRRRDEVPLADDGGLVAGGPQEFREGGLRAVESAVGVVVKAVRVTIFAREDGRSARPADGVGDEATVEPHPLARDPINVRRRDELERVRVRADRLESVVVAKDQDDVGRLGGRARGLRLGRRGGGGAEGRRRERGLPCFPDHPRPPLMRSSRRRDTPPQETIES